MQAVPPLCPAQCRQPLLASVLHDHVLGLGMRLHQPHRFLQQAEPGVLRCPPPLCYAVLTSRYSLYSLSTARTRS